jgi:predicted ribosomally synthesized peptide with nif11-like leader
MSFDSAQSFLEKIASDDQFRTHLVSELSKKRAELVKAAGFDFTDEELEKAKSGLPPGALGHVAGWFCDVEEEHGRMRGRSCGGGLWH